MALMTSNGIIAGPFDLIMIMQDTSTGKFHASFWVDRPLPGPVDPHPSVIRLKSNMHHTEGSETFEGAVEHVKEMRLNLTIDDTNVWIDPSQVCQRNFAEEGHVGAMVVPTWK